MWQRAQLKEEAKYHLKKYYWMGFVVCLCFGIVSGVSSNGRFSVNINSSFGSVVEEASYYSDPSEMLSVLLPVLLIGLVGGAFVFIISVAVRLFVANILEVGLNRFFMESREFASRFETLFAAYTSGSQRFWNIFKAQLLRWLWTMLWSWLFIIPGIVKGYQYAMVPYLLSECPMMPYQRAFELSKLMTDGEKWKMFVLDWSFIGWYLLCIPTCGLGLLFLNPYLNATKAELYAALREKAFGLGFSGPEELAGYPRPQ